MKFRTGPSGATRKCFELQSTRSATVCWPTRTNMWSSPADNLTWSSTGDTVFIGDRNTDMKALVEKVAGESPEIV